MRNKLYGFTLIELLVVIAVIALLLAILLPTLSKVKQKAKIVVCETNQRQLIVGLTIYANNNHDRLPPSPSLTNAGLYHRPYELNWYQNSVGLSTSRPFDKYEYAGRFLQGYLPEVNVYNCSLSKIDDSTQWPPKSSGLAAVGTYGEFYRSGEYAPLHSTYQLLWSYGGYLEGHPRTVETGNYYEGPKRLSDRNKLVVQDSLFYLTTNTNMLWSSPSWSWFSCHPFKGSGRSDPYYTIKDTAWNYQTDQNCPVNSQLNAGYIDGSVRRFNTERTKKVMNYNAIAFISSEYQ